MHCLFSLPVVRLESSLSTPVSQKLTSNQLPQSSEDLLQVLVQNSSQESRTLRAQMWTLHTQVLLLTLPLIIPQLCFTAGC